MLKISPSARLGALLQRLRCNVVMSGTLSVDVEVLDEEEEIESMA